MSIGSKAVNGFDSNSSDSQATSPLSNSDLLNALNSTESPSWDRGEESDPVISSRDADIGEDAESDGSEQGSASASTNSDAGQAAAAKAAEEWFDFKANGKGVRFNLADKEAIKKILPLAHGARQWQAERDSWKNKHGEIEKPYNDLKSNWDKLEAAYKQDGVDGILDILGGKPGYAKEYMERKYAERLQYEKAPEHERSRIDYENRIAELDRQTKRQAEEASQWKAQFQQRQEAEQEAQVIADLRPHYNEFRFDGKLRNSEMEKEYNNILWDKASEGLAKAAEAGQPLTQSLIRSEFKKVHDRYANVLKINQEEATAKAIQSTKTAAKKNLASQVRSETTSSAASGNKGKTASSSASLSSQWAKMFGVK